MSIGIIARRFMRTRFTFISLLLLILLGVGFFLSYMEGFLTFDTHELLHSVQFWSQPAPPQKPSNSP